MYGIYCTGKVICLSTFVSHLRERGGGKEGKEKYLAEINTFSSGVSRGFNCPSLPNKSKWNKSLVTTKTKNRHLSRPAGGGLPTNLLSRLSRPRPVLLLAKLLNDSLGTSE